MMAIRTIRLAPARRPERRSEPVPIRTAVEEAYQAIATRAARRRSIDAARLLCRVRAAG